MRDCGAGCTDRTCERLNTSRSWRLSHVTRLIDHLRQFIATHEDRDSLSAATLVFLLRHLASVLTFFPVRAAAAAPTTSHEGAMRHIEKEELEMRPSNSKSSPTIVSCTIDSTGRVRHDERGTAVWDWALDTGVFDASSSSGLMRRLDVADLTMQESPGLSLAVASRDAGGGGDPYNFRGAERRASVPPRTRLR